MVHDSSFRGWGFGFWVSRFRDYEIGFRVQVVGFGV
jgi:hypothetical protein